jgi:hypothetical protein
MSTKKTPEQRLAELNEQQAKIEAQLKQKRAAIVRQKQQQQAKITNAKRKADTRRKVLIGAAVLAQVEAGGWSQEMLTKLLNVYLTRDDDRQLFDLPPRVQSDSSDKPQQTRPEPNPSGNS